MSAVGWKGGGVGWGCGMVLIPVFHTVYLVLTLLDYGVIVLLTTLTGLLSAYIVYRVIKPRLQATIRGYIPVIGKTIRSEMSNMAEKALEGVDLGDIASKIGGGLGGLGDIAGLLGGGGGGLGDLLKLLGQFSGKGKEGGGSSGW